MKKFIINIFKNKIFKVLIILLILLFFIKEGYAIYIDNYNFKQLEKIKIILKDLKRNDKQFFYLDDFNKIYNSDISPIKNCYYLRNYKSEDRVMFTFGFKLESLIYTHIYGTKYYAYPEYDLPLSIGCVQGGQGCIDVAKSNFIKTISNPCKD